MSYDDFEPQNERRSKKLAKRKSAWKGGGFAPQQKRMEQNDFYAREKLKDVKKRIRIRMTGDEYESLNDI